MKRSLTALCLLLCLASVAAAQNANATGTPDARVQNANAASPVPLVVQPGQPVSIEVGPKAEPPKGLNPLFKDWVDIIAKVATPISLIVAVILAWQQIKKNRDDREKERDQRELNRQQREADVAQRRDELRWRKSQLAREILKGLHDDPYATDMMTMLDWNKREFSVKSSRTQPGQVETISWEELWAALRVTELHFNDKEKFIRDCLDAFFSRMQTIEHYIKIELIELEDVAYPFDYYLETLDGNPIMFENFIRNYHPRAALFIERLKKFEASKASASQTLDEAEAAEASSEPAADDTGAYFMFDCPPREERFYVRVEDSSAVAEAARRIMVGKAEGRLSGAIVSGKDYYNERWDFYVDPASITFVESDPEFAHQVNKAIEAQLKRPKKRFPEDDVWHTGGARLLAELPAGWFALERGGRHHEGLAALRAQGRVADTAASGGATEDISSLS
jgi:hypothetical protein